MAPKLFERWFIKSFVPIVGSKHPVLLIFDGHSSHVTPKLKTAAQKHLITILKLPAHTSHIFQQLDVACLCSMKSKREQKLVAWQRQNVEKQSGKKQFARILSCVWDDFSTENIISGFKNTGIHDSTIKRKMKVNQFAILPEVFDKKALDDYNNTQKSDAKVSKNSSSTDTTSTTALETASTSSKNAQSANTLDMVCSHKSHAVPTKHLQIASGADVLTYKNVEDATQKDPKRQV